MTAKGNVVFLNDRYPNVVKRAQESAALDKGDRLKSGRASSLDDLLSILDEIERLNKIQIEELDKLV